MIDQEKLLVGRPSSIINRAFNRGCQARLDGQPLTANPYTAGDPDGGRKHNAFRAGWLDVQHNWGAFVRDRVGPLPATTN